MELFASAPGLAVEESYVRLLNHLPGLAYRCRVGRTDPIVSERLEYTLEFVSKGSYDLLGIPAEDMVRNNNNTIERMMHPDDLQKTRRNMYDSIVAHQPYQVMYRVSLPSGRLKWIWDQGEGVFDADGELRYLEGLMMDISEQKFQELELKEENRQLKASVSNLYGLGNIVGKSEAMRRVYGLILKAAETDTNVIIYGETGSGKDLVAKAIHEYSARKGNYVPVNCGAIPEQLLESEFFGHTKGAFSGAHANKEGYIGAAHNGTLFLDEIGDMPLGLQSKLLRALQDKEFTPVGGSTPIKVDTRILAATNRDLPALIAEGRFREDLYYRLNVMEIKLPPLRERQGDIAILGNYLLGKFSAELNKPIRAITPEAKEMLERLPYPGNVRQLANILEYACILCQDGVISKEDFPEYVTRTDGTGPSGDSIDDYLSSHSLKDIEKRAIEATLQRCGGKRVATAAQLGISKRGLLNKLKEYGVIDRDTPDASSDSGAV